MNSTAIVPIILRLIGLALLQGLVLKGASTFFGGDYFHIILFPLFIITMSFSISRPVHMILAFLLGLFVDMFYSTPGIHASASVFTAYIRPLILRWFEPREGYNINDEPTKRHYGFAWYAKYSSVMMFLHLFFYYSVESFTYYYIVDILLRTVSSFVLSMFFILLAAIPLKTKPR
jgi:hypothetical protein